MMTTEIKEGQIWRSVRPAALRSAPEIRIISIRKNGMIRIERTYTGESKPKKDELTPQGLRRFYLLLHEQESLL